MKKRTQMCRLVQRHDPTCTAALFGAKVVKSKTLAALLGLALVLAGAFAVLMGADEATSAIFAAGFNAPLSNA